MGVTFDSNLSLKKSATFLLNWYIQLDALSYNLVFLIMWNMQKRQSFINGGSEVTYIKAATNTPRFCLCLKFATSFMNLFTLVYSRSNPWLFKCI